METLDRLQIKAREAAYRYLENIMDIVSLGKEDRTHYDESLKAYGDDFVAEVHALERACAEGYKESYVEAFVKGFIKGYMEGYAEGVKEGRVAIIQRLKRKGFSSEEIANMLDLPLDKIEAL